MRQSVSRETLAHLGHRQLAEWFPSPSMGRPNGMYPELLTRTDIKTFLPPIGGNTVYIFGDPDFVGQRVIGVERKKDGTLDARLDSTRATSDAKGKTYYELQ